MSAEGPERPDAPDGAGIPAGTGTPGEPGPGGRPWIERLGLAAIAVVFALLFGFVAVVAFGLGEPFLGVMGAVGCLMTLWVGGITLVRR